ncbi:MAG: GNAT family N-acetyltransferase [Bacteroidales bacterium]
MYQLLEWDSRFFGFGIASISSEGFTSDYIEPLLTTLKIQGIRLAYCFLPPDDLEKNALAVKYGGFLADKKVTFKKNVPADLKRLTNPCINTYNGPLIPELENLAIQTSHMSRFRIDPCFPSGSADRLYIKWMENSLNKQLANEVLVYRENQSILGMITLSLKQDTGIIGLLGVDTEQRGKNIGSELVDASEDFISGKGVQQLEVVTQMANTGACRFYEKTGFVLFKVVNIYHFWIN